MDYQARYCQKCVHDVKQDCAVWLAHLLANYNECNNPDSTLHLLIPRSKDGLYNEKCKMFIPRESCDTPTIAGREANTPSRGASCG